MSESVEDPVSLSLDLLRRLPPAEVSKNVKILAEVLPDYADDLYSGVDQPLTLRIDPTPTGAHREYLCCDYNRIGNSWRSCISNTYQPDLSEEEQKQDLAVYTAGKLRELELRANAAFEVYRKLTYLWDVGVDSPGDPPANFAGVILFKKVATVAHDDRLDGPASVKSAKYKFSSTVMLTLNRHQGVESCEGNIDLSGSLSRETEETMKVIDATGHIHNLGRIVEEVESKIRNQLQEIYFGKTSDIVNQLRSLEDLEAARNLRQLQEELRGGWQR
ncbi:F-actin-capping protein subunit beta [Malassezia yamatoensis]|uniref:F-actin-capping protein subunit beta n=1 Tax=Malassezia yamatoensis TaxID=253288 RepID=A0AAJ5YTE8_9BASI|nr:F-actin-capping protein subunit beta [Malassezia yamatoensis]